jgi:hypothetical protein
VRTRSLIRCRIALTAVVLALIAGCAAAPAATSASGTKTAAIYSASGTVTALTSPTYSASGTVTAPARATYSAAGTVTAPASASDPAAGATSASAADPATAEGPPSSCDGVPAPTSWQLLPPSATVVEAVMCTDTQKYVPGHGMWTYRQVLPLPAAKIPALVAGLTELDKPRSDGPCTANLIVVPPFVVTLADGTRLRPRAPSDGCHPRKEVITALNTGTMAPIAESRTTQVLGELQTRTNCGDDAKSPALWISASNRQAGKVGQPILPSSGSVSVCYYRTIGHQEGELTRAGTVPVQQLRTLWTKLPAGTSSACPPTPDIMNGPAVDWLMILPTPRPPYRFGDSGASPIALVELGGCRRLAVAVAGLAGDVPAAIATQLAALADQPVH